MPPSPRRRPDASQQALQSKGVTLAVIAGTAGVMVVGGYMLFGKSPRAALAPAAVSGVKAPPLPSGADPRHTTASSDVRIDLMDKKDPGRQAGRLIFSEMDPLEAHHYA